MESGKYAAVECGGAASLDECWQIVRAYERTGNHCMFLENCCYGREEMTLLRMIKDGVFGELVHAEGAYQHDLREKVTFGSETASIAIQTICTATPSFIRARAGTDTEVSGINRGNRMLTLTSTASKAA